MKTFYHWLRVLILVGTFALAPGRAGAQEESKPEYQGPSGTNNQLGIRLGGYSGFTYRHFSERQFGVEVSVLGWVPEGGAVFSALAEKNIPLPQRFSFYYGVGGFVGSYYGPMDSYYYSMDRVVYVYGHQPAVGVEGVVGLDYLIPHTPLQVGVDIRPRIAFFFYPYPWDGGLNIRYVFK